jgi:Phloem protein 2
VAELLKVWWLEITARIRFDELLPETNYAAHLIFKTTPNSRGLDAFQVAMVSSGSLQWKKVVCLKPRVMRSRNKTIGLPVKRLDGWMELELGRIYCDDGTRDTEVAVSLMETDDENEKGGLIVAGIEVRPIENA